MATILRNGVNMAMLETLITLLQTFLTITKDIVTIIATSIAAVVAITGLQTWRKQLKGNAEYELARDILVAVYRVRDAIRNCKFPPIPEPLEEVKKFHDQQLPKLDDMLSNLDIELLEAEAIWGENQNIMTSISEFRALATAVKPEYQLTYILPSPGENIYYFPSLFSWGEDDYSPKVERAVKKIEYHLRPKLMAKARWGQRKWW
jgi:hypothetical protein